MQNYGTNLKSSTGQFTKGQLKTHRTESIKETFSRIKNSLKNIFKTCLMLQEQTTAATIFKKNVAIDVELCTCIIQIS